MMIPHQVLCSCCCLPQKEVTGSMLFEDKVEAAERRRKDGNVLFQASKYKEALSKYTMVSSA
jgi:hypothetical protein